MRVGLHVAEMQRATRSRTHAGVQPLGVRGQSGYNVSAGTGVPEMTVQQCLPFLGHTSRRPADNFVGPLLRSFALQEKVRRMRIPRIRYR
jgi:hypothetical protein